MRKLNKNSKLVIFEIDEACDKYYESIKVQASNRLWNSCFNNNYIGKL